MSDQPARIPRCPHCGMAKWCRTTATDPPRPPGCTRIDGGDHDGIRREYVEAYGEDVL